MAIKLNYEPVAAIAQGAYLGGLGEYNLDQQKLALQSQRDADNLSARLYMAAQDNMARQQAQMFQARQAQMHRAQDWEAQHNRDLMQRDWQAQDKDTARANQLADIEAQRAWELDKLPVVAGFQAATRGGDELETEIGRNLTGLSSQRKFMSPEGVNALTEFSTEYRAIQKARKWAEPQDYARVLSEFQEKMARADLGQHVNVPKPTPEAFEEETLEVPGEGRYARDRSGAWRHVSPPQKPDPNELIGTPTAKGFLDYIKSNRKAFTSEEGKFDLNAAKKQYLAEIEASKKIESMTFEDAVKEIETREQADQRHNQAYVQMLDGMAQRGEIPPSVLPPPSQALREAQPGNQQWNALKAQLQEQYGGRQGNLVGAGVTGPNGQHRAWYRTPDGTVHWRDELEASGWFTQGQPPGSKSILRPAGASPPATPDNKRLSPTQEPLTLALPKPQTLEEAMALGSGAAFQWTDGSVRVVP